MYIYICIYGPVPSIQGTPRPVRVGPPGFQSGFITGTAIQKHRCRAHSMQNKINSSCVDLEMCLYSLIFVWRSMDVTCMLCPQLPVVIEILRFLF